MKQREFDIHSNDNTLFTTSQCNNRCIMCCQPPLATDDIEDLYQENIERIMTAPKELPSIGITGGEPTLLGDKLISLVALIREQLPHTDIHILSNGRAFVDGKYTLRLAEAGGGRLMVGVPLHSDYSGDHDMIAGCKDAFNETMIGLYNLAAANIGIELRIVMNALNYKRFFPMAQFIHRNLPFVDWIAFMGMEYVGYAVKHSKNIWIEPKNYIPELCDAVKYLAEWNYDVCIYNIPLCLLPVQYRPFAEQSISDWKNKYLDFCEKCSVKANCCGLFSTSIKPYEGLKPI